MQSPAPPKEWLLTLKALSNLYGQAEKHSWALDSSLVPLFWAMQNFLNMWGSTVAWAVTNSSTINSKMPVFCTLHTLSLPSEMAESFLNPARRSEIVQAIYCWEQYLISSMGYCFSFCRQICWEWLNTYVIDSVILKRGQESR